MKDEQKPSRPPAGGQILNAAELYPRISEIVGRTGDEVKLGGTVKESRTFDSRETTTYNWDYTVTNPRMRQLYHRAKTAQWVAEDLPWDTDVDLEKPIFDIDPALSQSDYMRKMGKKERARVTIQYNTNHIRNFAHGEQGALLAAARGRSLPPHGGSSPAG